MTRNMNTFQTLQAKIGTVTFGNDNSSKVLIKGTITMENKDIATKNVLLIENMKHNLLSVSQMCDQGHVLTFTSKYCKIQREDSGKFITTTSRTPNTYTYWMKSKGKGATWERKMRVGSSTEECDISILEI